MNLTTNANQLPPPDALEVAARNPWLRPKSKHSGVKVAGIAVAVLIGMAAVGAAQSHNDDTGSSSSASSADIDQTALEIVWSGKSGEDRDTLCFGYKTAPETMWDSFNEGSKGEMSRATWDRFFDVHC